MKKFSVSICIPAHNEEWNIKRLLTALSMQISKFWYLRSIDVYCDGCTDDTVGKAREVLNHRIKIIDDNKRLGKTRRLQQMFKNSNSDIIVLLDADIDLEGQDVINDLISPLINDKSIHLSGGNSQPHLPHNFVENAVFSTFKVFYKSRIKLKSGNNIFGCTGSIMAISKELSKQIKLPNIINEDAYIYLYCISKGYKFKYVDNAVIHYHLPQNFRDYVKQLLRSEPIGIEAELSKYFGKLIKNELHRPLYFYIIAVFEVLIQNPLGVLSIIVINLIFRPLSPIIINNYKLEWFIAKSTKIART